MSFRNDDARQICEWNNAENGHSVPVSNRIGVASTEYATSGSVESSEGFESGGHNNFSAYIATTTPQIGGSKPQSGRKWNK